MRAAIMSHLSDEELLREVEARNFLDPMVLELATRFEALLPNTQPPNEVINRFLEKRMQGKA
jgi:hypothetical protein